MSKHIIPTELYTKESEDSLDKASIEALVPDPDEETAKEMIAKNTIKEEE